MAVFLMPTVMMETLVLSKTATTKHVPIQIYVQALHRVHVRKMQIVMMMMSVP